MRKLRKLTQKIAHTQFCIIVYNSHILASLKLHMKTIKSTKDNATATAAYYGTQLTDIIVSYEYKSNKP